MTIAGYTPSTLTLGALVEGVLSYLQAQQQNAVTSLTADITSSATSFVVDDASSVSAGLIEVDTELMQVVRADLSTNTVTIAPRGRGYRGTTAATHTAGAEVRIRPLMPYSSVIREINNELSGLYPKMSWVSDYEFTYDPTKIAFDLPADVGLVLDVRYLDRLNEWQRVRNWEMEKGQDTADVSSGASIRVYAPEALSTIRVVYGKRFGRPAALTDVMGTVTGLPSSCEDIITIGAACRLLPSLDVAKLSSVTIPNAEAAGRTPQPGTGVMVAREWRALYKDRIETEVSAFRKAYPVRVHHTR